MFEKNLDFLFTRHGAIGDVPRALPVIQDSLKSAITGALCTGELERGEDGRLRAR